MRRFTKVLAVALIAMAGVGIARSQDKQEKPASPEKAPEVMGAWTGTWGLYSPPTPEDEAKPPPAKSLYALTQHKMDCKVEQMQNAKWMATFEGEAGRPYKYSIKMPGRQVGGVILFNGTADLGPKDGGVFDWIGRATEKEFVGFFTSKGYTGAFRLARPK
jgi:hypothetical protein